MKRRLIDLHGRIYRYGRANPNVPQSILAFSIKLSGAALTFGFSFLVARHLGAAGNGAYALAVTTGQFAAIIALLGLDFLLLRTMAGDLREGKKALARGAARTALGITTLAAIVIGIVLAAVGAPLLNNILGESLDPLLIYLAAAAVVPLTLNRMAVASLRGAGSMLTAQWLDGPQTIVLAFAILAGILISRSGFDVTTAVVLYFGSAAVSAVIAWLLYILRVRSWPAPERAAVVPMLKQGWLISFVAISRVVIDWLVLVSLGSLFTTVEVGQFRTALQIAALVALIVSTFDTIAGPRIAGAWRIGDIAHIHKIRRQAVGTMMVISAPIFVLALGFPEWILGLFGPEFVPAATALRILALGQLVNILAGPAGTVMLMIGEERNSLIISIVALVALVLLCVTLVPAYGLVGAALTTSIIIVLRTMISWYLVRRSLRKLGG